MHSMSGNMSKEGMTKDLEAIADVGIGGVLMFNVTHAIPNGKVRFNSPEHIEILKHAAAECERLNLSFGIHNCDGWTSSGGPWVTPENSMKQVVFNETVSQGGGKITMQLPIPAARKGFYKDIAVIAYPSLESEIADANAKPKVTASDPDFDIQLATDGKSDIKTSITPINKKPAWVQFDFGKPFTVRSIYMAYEKTIGDNGAVLLLTSNDGIHFTEATELKNQRLGKKEHSFDDCFEGFTARYFRLQTTVKMDVREIKLSNTEHFVNSLARVSMFKIEDNRLAPLETPDKKSVVQKSDIIDLTKDFNPDGSLNTTLPKGNWTIMRFGYTITEAVNGPGSKEGTGLEIDKMDKKALDLHFNAYVANVLSATKEVAPNALQYVEIDSYEVGSQNWTKGYQNLFKEKYKYDLISFLPLYAGRYIDNAQITEAVLWDIRNFNSFLITENYFNHFTELCHQNGLISYVEPYSFNASFNELDAAKNVDIPMGEFWMHQRFQTETAVSGARIYGKNIVSSESFSAQPQINWKGHPGSMKLTGDIAWTLGINEFMFHRFAHQANTHVMPGMTMSQWGSHIDRTQTWWNNAGKAWFTYLSRGQFLLRQGVPVSNLVVFIGDGSPNSIIKKNAFKPAIPNNVNYDCINADALIHRLSVKNGKLTLPNGIQYDALALYNSETLSLPTLRKISELANQGAVIIGKKAKHLGGYDINQSDTVLFNQMSQSIWSKKTTFAQFNWEKIFAEQNIKTDLSIQNHSNISYIHRKTESEDIYFFYNPDSIENTFNCTFNISGKIPEQWDAVTGSTQKLAQFTLGDDQTIIPITLDAQGSAFIVFREAIKNTKFVTSQQFASEKPQITFGKENKLKMKVSSNGNYTIDFNTGDKKEIAVTGLPEPIALTNAWQVSFSKYYGIDTTIVLNNLEDWTENANFNIKHYSGTATYKTDFEIKKDGLEKDNRIAIDLGKVCIAARVFVNGSEVAVLWKTPYKTDITNFVKEGSNTLSIELTNLWTNRLIGDESFTDKSGYSLQKDEMPEWYTNNLPAPPSKRLTFCTYPFYKATDSLLPSGLLGPVQLQISKIISIP